MKPLNNFVLLIETAVESTTSSGIVLAGDVETGSKPGTVAAIGPEISTDILKEGDRVAVKWADGLPVTFDGKKGALVPFESIRAVY